MGIVGVKCPRIDVTVLQFGPIYGTETIAIVQCMHTDYVTLIMSFGMVGRVSVVYGVDVAYRRLSDWTRLQWALYR